MSLYISSNSLNRPDAVNLKQNGRFYFQVGNNEIFELGQIGWSDANYHPIDRYKKKIDNSVIFIGKNGRVLKEVKTENNLDNYNCIKQSEIIIKYINDIVSEKNIKKIEIGHLERKGDIDE